MEIKKGIVGFVDILGYKNIIENNEIEKLGPIIQEILNLAKDVKDIVKNDIKKSFYKKKDLDSFDKLYNAYEIESHVISDSIIFLGEINETDDIFNSIKFAIYIRFLQKLCRISLEKGFALRGAISYGDYINENNIIASKAHIEAYSLSEEKLNFSGIAVCSGFKNFCEKMDKEKSTIFLKKLYENTSEIHCQLKDGKEEKLLIIDWISGLGEGEYNGDLRQYLFNSFSKHNKDISQSVIRKIDNTENVLRSILAKNKFK